MSIETEIKNLTAAVNNLVNVLQASPGVVEPPVAAAPEAPAPEPSEPSEEAPAGELEQKVAEFKDLPKEDQLKVLKKALLANGMDSARDVLSRVGAKRVVDIRDEHIVETYERALRVAEGEPA